MGVEEMRLSPAAEKEFEKCCLTVEGFRSGLIHGVLRPQGKRFKGVNENAA